MSELRSDDDARRRHRALGLTAAVAVLALVGAVTVTSRATGDAKAGTVTLQFTRPVVVGDGTGFGQKPVPPVTDPYMSAMQLVVHMTDSTCSHPNGNAHRYLSGIGTDTITVEASSLVVGTTYLSITPGFVKSAGDNVALKWVQCIGITVT